MSRHRIIAVLTTIALATTAWAALTIFSHSGRLAAVERDVQNLSGWMERVDHKLDRLLER